VISVGEPAQRYRYQDQGDYIHGNTARKPDEYPAPARYREAERQPARRYEAKTSKRKSIRNNDKTVVVVTREKKTRVSLLSAVSLFIIFAGALGIVMMSAVTSNSRVALAQINTNIQTKQDSIDSLQASLTVTQSLAQIEDIAVNKLGMVQPKPYQIVHIQVPQQSYVVSGNSGGQ